MNESSADDLILTQRQSKKADRLPKLIKNEHISVKRAKYQACGGN